MKVQFTQNVEVKDGFGEVIESYKAGEVRDFDNEASALHWLNRGKATQDIDAAKQPEARRRTRKKTGSSDTSKSGAPSGTAAARAKAGSDKAPPGNAGGDGDGGAENPTE